MDMNAAIILSVAFMVTILKLYKLRSFDTKSTDTNTARTLLQRETTRHSVDQHLQKLFGPDAAGLVPNKHTLAYYCSRTAVKGDAISRGQTELLEHPELQLKLNIYFAPSPLIALVGPGKASLNHTEPALLQEDLEMSQFLDEFFNDKSETQDMPPPKGKITMKTTATIEGECEDEVEPETDEVEPETIEGEVSEGEVSEPEGEVELKTIESEVEPETIESEGELETEVEPETIEDELELEAASSLPIVCSEQDGTVFFVDVRSYSQQFSPENKIEYDDLESSFMNALSKVFEGDSKIMRNVALQGRGARLEEGVSLGRQSRLFCNVNTSSESFRDSVDLFLKAEYSLNPHVQCMVSQLSDGSNQVCIVGCMFVAGYVRDERGTMETYVQAQRKHRDSKNKGSQIIVVVHTEKKDLKTLIQYRGKYRSADTSCFWFDPWHLHCGAEDRSMVGKNVYPYAQCGRFFLLMCSAACSDAELHEMQEEDGTKSAVHWKLDFNDATTARPQKKQRI